MKQISLLFVVLLFDVVFPEKYIITRRSRTSRGQLQPDLVQIPSSLCHNNGTTECELMDGERHSVCQCICSKKDEHFRSYKSTFQFQNETWKCAKNAALHKLSGTRYYFMFIVLYHCPVSLQKIIDFILYNQLHFIFAVSIYKLTACS